MVIIYYYIRDFFSFIGTIVKSFFDVVLSLINILIASGKFLFDVVSALPVSIKIFCTVIIVVCLLYKILGREGGSE